MTDCVFIRISFGNNFLFPILLLASAACCFCSTLAQRRKKEAGHMGKGSKKTRSL